MTHEDAIDALPLLALQTADRDMRVALHAHVRDCTICQAALAEHQVATDALGRGVDQVRPRSELRTRVLANVAGAGRGPAVAARAGAGASRWRWGAVAAAAVLAIALAVAFLNVRRQIAELRAEVIMWQGRATDAEARAAGAADEASSQRRVVSVLTAPDVRYATLSGLPAAPSSRGRAFVSMGDGTLVLSAQNLPPLPPGRIYQLWAIAGGTPVSAGIFNPDAEGRTQLVTSIPQLSAPPAVLAVTLEPAGGVPQPTGPQILAGPVSN